MRLVAVEATVAGLVSVPGLRVDGGDDPIGGDFAGDAQPPVVAGLKVLPEDGGQQLHRLGDRLVQVLAPGQDAEQRIPVTGPGIDQRLAGGLVVPIHDRLARAGVVVTSGKHLPQRPGQTGTGRRQQTADRRTDQRDRVHRGDRVIQRRGIQHSSTAQQPGLASRGERDLEDPIRAIRAAQPFPHVALLH
jgi:hypothetical protein